ncbi:MAG: hypothetical protein ACYCUI_14635 [Vulcanimicrobiaceae bacterium]
MAATLVVFVVVLILTRDAWLVNPSQAVERQVDILSQLLVGVGTAALAVVTWASVYETQKVLSDEDLRFRRSRMPVLKLTARPDTNTYDFNPGYEVVITNVGDGAAQNVRLSIRAHVHISWNKEGLAEQRDLSTDKDFACEDHVVCSYLEKRGETTVTFPSVGDQLVGMNALLDNRVPDAVLVYEDIFGETYRTRYIISETQAYDEGRFAWEPPSALQLERARRA